MKPLLLHTLLLLAAAPLPAADWPQWRGPNFNGSTDERGLPVDFSPTRNIAWTAELRGAAASTPVVCGDHVFLSGIDATNQKLEAICLDRRTGREVWRHNVAGGVKQDWRSNYANPSPVTDGKLAIFLYGNGELCCFDARGVSRWSRNLQKDYGEFAFFWTFGGSPLLFDGRCYVQVLQRNVPANGRGRKDGPIESFLLALDPETGETLWRHVRPSKAMAESRESHTTPFPLTRNGQKQLIVAGGDALTAHDAATGKELWRWDAWNPARSQSWPLIASPLATGEVALVCVPKNQPVYAIRLDGAGQLDETAVAWHSRTAREVTSEVPTPALYDGDFFVLSDSRKSLSRVDPRTGKVKWSLATPGPAKYEASPLAADGRIYLINFDGQVAIVDAATGELQKTISMDEPAEGELARASIIAAHGQLLIRTTRKLWCVGISG